LPKYLTTYTKRNFVKNFWETKRNEQNSNIMFRKSNVDMLNIFIEIHCDIFTIFIDFIKFKKIYIFF